MSDDRSIDENSVAKQIFELAKQVAEQSTTDEHFRAIQALLQVANQIFVGIYRMVTDQNGLAAESLLRTLFEAAINGIILAKHKELLNDFIRHGQFTHLRLLRFTNINFAKEKIVALLQATDEDWQKLFAEFKHAEWHKLKTTDSFSEAEMAAELYDKYFRRASAFAHAEPYVVVRKTDETWKNWAVEARSDLWKWSSEGATIHAYFVMCHLLAIISREFKLGLEEELGNLRPQLDGLSAKLAKASQSALDAF